MVSDFQNQIEQVARDSELSEVKEQMQSFKDYEGQEKFLQSIGVDKDTQEHLSHTADTLVSKTEQITNDANTMLEESKAEDKASSDSTANAPLASKTSR